VVEVVEGVEGVEKVICGYSLCIRGYSVVYLEFSFYRVNEVMHFIGKKRERGCGRESERIICSPVILWLFIVILSYLS